MTILHTLAEKAANALADPNWSERSRAVRLHDLGHGYDWFGMHREEVALADALFWPLYRSYFRVRSHGYEHIPTEGAAILAGNHSGTLPFDAAMLWLDVLHHTQPPRVVRFIADYFVPWLPVAGTLLARCGSVTGTRGNMKTLLEAGELVGVFPEGVTGIAKNFNHRYELQRWRQGHCELAIRHRVPVIPFAVVGAEYQMPQLARIALRGPLPHLPVPLTPIPLPVRYDIFYGTPIPLGRDFAPEDADDPRAVASASARIRRAVEQLLTYGRRLRRLR